MYDFVKTWRRVREEKNNSQGKRPQASAEHLREVFESHRQDLVDLALFLTGKADLAEACVVGASAPATQGNPAFLEWLEQWARHATVRSAIALMHAQIAEAASKYEGVNCQHHHRTPLPADIARALHAQHIEADRFDALARFALALRGLEDDSSVESGLSLGVSAAQVEAAYCAALQTLGLEPADRENAFSR